MAQLLSGKTVAAALDAGTQAAVSALREQGVCPTLAIVRVGERADDIAYERGASKRCRTLGLGCRPVTLPAETTEAELLAVMDRLNRDPGVHSVLLFRPLPKHIHEDTVRRALAPEKDADGITDGSLAGVFSNTAVGFPPCTAQACVELLDYYGIDCTGKTAVVVGRSLVVGKPAALLLMNRNATVTVCHTKTRGMADLTRRADIVVVAAGRMQSLGAEYFSAGQIVIDVGIHWNEASGTLCGDVRFSEVEPLVKAITPVPGGVGSVTTSLLMAHVVEAARRTL